MDRGLSDPTLPAADRSTIPGTTRPQAEATVTPIDPTANQEFSK